MKKQTHDWSSHPAIPLRAHSGCAPIAPDRDSPYQKPTTPWICAAHSPERTRSHHCIVEAQTMGGSRAVRCPSNRLATWQSPDMMSVALWARHRVEDTTEMSGPKIMMQFLVPAARRFLYPAYSGGTIPFNRKYTNACDR